MQLPRTGRASENIDLQLPSGTKDSAVSRITSLCEWVLRLPIVWGGVAALAFYAMLSQKWINSPLLEQYMAGHRVEYIVGYDVLRWPRGRRDAGPRSGPTIRRARSRRRSAPLLPAAKASPIATGCSINWRSCPPSCTTPIWCAASAKRSNSSAARNRPTRSTSILRHLEDLDAFRMQSSYNIGPDHHLGDPDSRSVGHGHRHHDGRRQFESRRRWKNRLAKVTPAWAWPSTTRPRPSRSR